MRNIERVVIAVSVFLAMCTTGNSSAEAGVVYVGPRWVPGPYYYPYRPYYVYREPQIVVREPDVFVQQERSPSEERSYWYFCRESQAYYPQVKQCLGGWMKVVPSAPAPPASPTP